MEFQGILFLKIIKRCWLCILNNKALEGLGTLHGLTYSRLDSTNLTIFQIKSPPVNLSANGSVDLSSHANLRQQQRLQQNNSSNHSNSLEIGNSDRNNASSPDGHSSPSSSTCSKGGLISEGIQISVRSSFRLTK